MSAALLRLAAALPADEYVSGAALAERARVPRAQLRRSVQRLRDLGLAVEGRAGRGYRLQDAPELLDAGALRAGLAPPARRSLRDLEIVGSIDSTNSEMLRREGERFHGVALFAEHQGGGRGRRGRRWHSPFARNIYLSVGWRYRRAPADLAFLPLAVAVAAAEALESVVPARVGLKWPNDLLLDGRKVGGCLVETRLGARGCRVVAGVGVNVRMGDEAARVRIDQPWTDLASRDAEVSRNRVAAHLLAELLPALERFHESGFEPFRERWAARDALRGRRVTLYREDQALRGRAAGLGPSGGLLLESGDGPPVECLAGEVTSHAP